MDLGGPEATCGVPPSEEENEGPVSSSSLRMNPQLLQTISPLSSSLTKVPLFPQFGHLSGISPVSLSAGPEDKLERVENEIVLFTSGGEFLPDDRRDAGAQDFDGP